jgi:hypothetical protein
MKWADAAQLALRGVTRRLGRAALTVLAVALAATLLVALSSVSGTTKTRVLGQLAKGGPLAGIRVAAAAPDLSQLGNDDAKPGPAKSLTDAALSSIRALPQTHEVIPLVGTPVLIVADRPAGAALPPAVPQPPDEAREGRPVDFIGQEIGADLRQAKDLPITILAGRLPRPGSTTEIAVTPGFLSRMAVARGDAARFVGTEITVGAPQLARTNGQRVLRGRWHRYLVTGVVAQEAAGGELLADLGPTEQNRAWTLAGTAGFGITLPKSPYVGAYVVADKLDDVGAVRSRITQIGYSTQAPENLLATVRRYLHVVEIVLSGIGVIGLVIASLGIANALLAAVRERRREIGVLKAIGARDVDVLRVFLLEAVVLGLLGGLVGTAAGYGVAAIVAAVVSGYLHSQDLAAVHASLPMLLAIAGVFGSGLLALVAGAVPAWRASRLPARDAMGAT